MKSQLLLITFFLSILITGCNSKNPKSFEYWDEYHNEVFNSPLTIVPNSKLLINGKYKSLCEDEESNIGCGSLMFKELDRGKIFNVLTYNHDEYTYRILPNNIITFERFDNRSGENWFKYVGLFNGNKIYLNFKLISGNENFPPVINKNIIYEFASFKK